MAEIQIDERKEIIAKVETFLSELGFIGFDINAAYLYGSYASGNMRSDSDIDVAIVSSDLSGDRLEDWCRLNGIATRVDSRMEVIGFRPEQFRDENPLAWEIKNNGIRLI